MKKALRKGTQDDLNIYTANLGGGLLGWATFPTVPASAPYGRRRRPRPARCRAAAPRRTTWATPRTHEVGHWLGLYHTFQGGCTSNGDYVADTPAEASAGLRLPDGPRHLPSQPARDPITNFMDYTDDACMNQFSAGQGTRMQNSWVTYRQGK